jgi:hypothetical protein
MEKKEGGGGGSKAYQFKIPHQISPNGPEATKYRHFPANGRATSHQSEISKQTPNEPIATHGGSSIW